MGDGFENRGDSRMGDPKNLQGPHTNVVPGNNNTNENTVVFLEQKDLRNLWGPGLLLLQTM